MKRIYGAALVLLSLSFCILASCISRSSLRPVESMEVSESFYTQNVMPTRQPEPEHDTVLLGHVLFMAEDAGTGTASPAPESAAPSPTVAPLGAETAQQPVPFGPEEPVTRGEAARYIYALVKDKSAPADAAAYTDVPAGSACYAAVEKLAELDIMHGYGDGSFRPDAPVTRAELVAALCRAMGEQEVAAIAFSDVTADHWAMGYVAAAMTKGWLSGYDDGQFYPDSPVTRAETASLLNRVREREPSRLAIDTACETSPYTDVDRRYWAYYDIIDASYTNTFLSYILGEVAGMQPGFMLLGDQLCHVSPVTMRLDYFEEGFHTVADGLDSDGVYYVPENGYFLRRNPQGLQEFDGSMFYTEVADGPFKANFDLGYLHFGEDGRYTSGDKELDGYVDAIMANIIQGQSSSLLNETKLRAAYDHLITGGYDYMARPYGWQRGTTSWTLDCAKTMLETKRGACFYWAAAFLYMARRLGYQAYPICGGVNEYNALHAWVMIDEDGIEYIYDVEMDWAYRTGAHGRTPIRYGRDLFKQRRGMSVITYYFPGDTYAPPPQDEEALFDDAPMITWPEAPYAGDVAYVDVDGELVPVAITWSEELQEDGSKIVTATITYDGATYTMSYIVLAGEETEPTTQPSDQPSTETSPQPSDQTTTEPSADPSTEPSTDTSTEPSTEPETSEEPSTAPETSEPSKEPESLEQPVGASTD